VNDRGNELLLNGKISQAVPIFKLNLAMHPDSANPYDSLAQAQEAAGDKEPAIANYRKALAIGHR
jgi:D-alanyl-D-alanine-carboxypeptidase/D-alanyl-D-alanine-endopeptidase